VAVGTDPSGQGQFGLTVLTPIDHDNIERYLPNLARSARKLAAAHATADAARGRAARAEAFARG
jgi:hypothetical protein